MRKSLLLQRDLYDEFGACVVDVTLDCEDGAPVGAEAEHAALVAALLADSDARCRIGVRVHAVEHPAFWQDVQTIVGGDAATSAVKPAYIMLPKVESAACVVAGVAAIDAAGGNAVPVHVLLESPLALHRAHEIAAHPRVESLSFGLMDFVSAHGGAIPSTAMGVEGQFAHPLVVRAKLELASAAHAHGKVPSHCVVTEFRDQAALRAAARKARDQFGYTRMWSIHPDQIRTIVDEFAPDVREIELATRVMCAAAGNDWGPAQVDGVLHDRASYRFFWQILERAHHTGRALPAEMAQYFS